MNLPAGKAGPQITKQRQIPGRDGVDATFACQLFNRKIQRFTGKFREPHQPLHKPGELFPTAKKIGGVIAVREHLETRSLPLDHEKPQEGGLTLSGRGIPEISIAGRQTGHHGAPSLGAGRGGEPGGTKGDLEPRGDPLEFFEAQQPSRQPLRREPGSGARVKGREKTRENCRSLPGERLAGG